MQPNELERVEYGWSVRSSMPSPELPVFSLHILPAEEQLPRRGSFLIKPELVEAWRALEEATHKGATLALRAPSGRNYEIALGWDERFPAGAEQSAVLPVEELSAKLAAHEGVRIHWQAARMDTFNDRTHPGRSLRLVGPADGWGYGSVR